MLGILGAYISTEATVPVDPWLVTALSYTCYIFVMRSAIYAHVRGELTI